MSAYLLEKYIFGELPRNQIREIKQHLGSKQKITEFAENINQKNQDFLQLYPFENFTKQSPLNNMIFASTPILEFSKRQNILVSNRILGIAAMLILIITSSLVFWPRLEIAHIPPDDNITVSDPGIRSKGVPRLLIFKKMDNQIRLLQPGNQVKTGDVLQLTYLSENAKYGLIISIDGRGLITRHFPKGNDDTKLSKNQNKTALNNAYKLDDDPDYERFFFITAKSPININQAMKAAKKLIRNKQSAKFAKLSLPDSWSQVSTIFYKGDK